MSILQNILGRVGGQVNEDFFRQQLIQELGSTNFDDDGCRYRWICSWPIIFFHISGTNKTTIL